MDNANLSSPEVTNAAPPRARHVVARVADIPPGSRLLVHVAGKAIAVFNLEGAFYGLLDRCPHQGASLSAGLLTGLATSPRPGEYCMSRKGEMLRCPWHGWEFDVRTGQSWCEPARIKVKRYPAEVADGAAVVRGPYVADTVTVTVEDQYVIVEI